MKELYIQSFYFEYYIVNMDKNNYKITIITVVYNGSKTIEHTIRSVKNQSYNNVEYIVIDGNSTDGTQDIINKNLAYIDFYISESDNGIYDAMNKGLKYATGDIISFLNSGDWYELDILQNIVSYFSERSIDIILGGANVIDNGSVMFIRRSDISNIKFGIPCCHQAVFAKRRVFEFIGDFNIKYQICADYEWLLRAYNSNMNIRCVNDIFVNYLYGGISDQQFIHLIEEREKISMINARENNDKVLMTQINILGKTQKEEYIKNKLCYEIFLNNKNYVLDLLGRDTSYYIWGTGYYGRKCFKLFRSIDIHIKGFIDNKKLDSLYDYPVFLPQDIQENVIICIATPKYEKEIIAQLEKMCIDNKYICFSKLRDELVLTH